MKKIIATLIISFLTLFANAQEAKPTKEQTIEYIINTLKGSNVNFSSGENRNGNYEIVDIDFSNNVLTVTINMTYTSFDVKHFSEYVIDLKEIEKVDITKSSEVYFLNLGAFNSKKLIKGKTNSYYDGIKRPEDIEYRSTIGIPAPNDEKLIKAFSHLRKLCGAPEPIKF